MYRIFLQSLAIIMSGLLSVSCTLSSHQPEEMRNSGHLASQPKDFITNTLMTTSLIAVVLGLSGPLTSGAPGDLPSSLPDQEFAWSPELQRQFEQLPERAMRAIRSIEWSQTDLVAEIDIDGQKYRGAFHEIGDYHKAEAQAKERGKTKPFATGVLYPLVDPTKSRQVELGSMLPFSLSVTPQSNLVIEPGYGPQKVQLLDTITVHKDLIEDARNGLLNFRSFLQSPKPEITIEIQKASLFGDIFGTDDEDPFDYSLGSGEDTSPGPSPYFLLALICAGIAGATAIGSSN